MNQVQNATPLPVYAEKSMASRLPMLLAAVLVSTTVLGSVLGLFEMQSRDATLAKAAVPAGAASSVVATREVKTERRQRVMAPTDL